MATKFADFIQMAVRKFRGEGKEEELVIDYVRPFILLLLLLLILSCLLRRVDSAFIRLLDAVGKVNKYLVIQTLLCDFFFLQLLYICILEWKYICNVT